VAEDEKAGCAAERLRGSGRSQARPGQHGPCLSKNADTIMFCAAVYTFDSIPRSRSFHQLTARLCGGLTTKIPLNKKIQAEILHRDCIRLYRHSDLILPHTRLVHRLALLHQCYSARHTSRKVRPYFVSIPTLFAVIARTKYTPLQYFCLCLRVTPVSSF
jgi:hypothetical protein